MGKAIGGVPFRTGEMRRLPSHLVHDSRQIVCGHTSFAAGSLVKKVVKVSYGLRLAHKIDSVGGRLRS